MEYTTVVDEIYNWINSNTVPKYTFYILNLISLYKIYLIGRWAILRLVKKRVDEKYGVTNL